MEEDAKRLLKIVVPRIMILNFANFAQESQNCEARSPSGQAITIPRGESENKYAKLRLHPFYHIGIKLVNHVLHAPPDENDDKFCYTITIQDELNKPVDMNDTGFELLVSFIEHKYPE